MLNKNINDMSNIGKDDGTDIKGYVDLANSIIYVAVNDYKYALEYSRFLEKELKRMDELKKDCKTFFFGKLFPTLTDLDPVVIESNIRIKTQRDNTRRFMTSEIKERKRPAVRKKGKNIVDGLDVSDRFADKINSIVNDKSLETALHSISEQGTKDALCLNIWEACATAMFRSLFIDDLKRNPAITQEDANRFEKNVLGVIRKEMKKIRENSEVIQYKDTAMEKKEKRELAKAKEINV